jgi:hypothetical protein
MLCCITAGIFELSALRLRGNLYRVSLSILKSTKAGYFGGVVVDAKEGDSWANGTMRCVQCSTLGSDVIDLNIKCFSGVGYLPESLFVDYSGSQLDGEDAIVVVPCKKSFNQSVGQFSFNCQPAQFVFGERFETLCVHPFEERLCAKCSCPLDCVSPACTCFFATNSGCGECAEVVAKPQFWVAIVLVVTSCVLFVFVPKKHAVLIWAELIIFLM